MGGEWVPLSETPSVSKGPDLTRGICTRCGAETFKVAYVGSRVPQLVCTACFLEVAKRKTIRLAK